MKDKIKTVGARAIESHPFRFKSNGLVGDENEHAERMKERQVDGKDHNAFFSIHVRYAERRTRI